MIPYSLLDLSPIVAGGTAAQSLANTLDLARHAEGWGYHAATGSPSTTTCRASPAPPRRWSSATSPRGTTTMRVGAGGIMLPNHSPLVIAEQFGTLESLHPGRIDLGLGRAPGTDQITARALRRDVNAAAEHFPDDVLELQALLGPAEPGQYIHAVPGAGTNVPLWILGSSLYGAQLAALLGLPYSFASHFAPDALLPALSHLSRALPALGPGRQALCHAGAAGGRRRQRGGGAPPVHLHPAGLRQHAAQRPRAAAGARSTISTATGRRPRRSAPRTC